MHIALLIYVLNYSRNVAVPVTEQVVNNSIKSNSFPQVTKLGIVLNIKNCESMPSG